jgi:hypothetical protein
LAVGRAAALTVDLGSGFCSKGDETGAALCTVFDTTLEDVLGVIVTLVVRSATALMADLGSGFCSKGDETGAAL